MRSFLACFPYGLNGVNAIVWQIECPPLFAVLLGLAELQGDIGVEQVVHGLEGCIEGWHGRGHVIAHAVEAGQVLCGEGAGTEAQAAVGARVCTLIVAAQY